MSQTPGGAGARAPLVVFYDGACGLCAGFVAWALRRDAAAALRPVAAQSEEGRRLLGARFDAALTSLHAWSPIAGMRTGPDAVAEVLERLPRWRWAGRLLRLAPMRPLAQRAYAFVARHRHGFARPSCALPGAPARR